MMDDVGVDWSQLPMELLEVVSSQLLPSETDLIRFRSVCSTWRRSSVSSPKSINSFPILPNQGISDTCWGFHLSKRTLYKLRSPIHSSSESSSSSCDWIIKVERDNPTRMHLLTPLSTSFFKPLPPHFPRFFDSSKFHLFELSHEYTLQYINYRPLANSIGDAGNLYMEKVALSFFHNHIDAPFFVLLTIHISGKLVIYKSGDKNWNLIDDLPAPYDDVIFKGGCFYAVDTTGRAVLVELESTLTSTPTVTPVAQSLHGSGDKKYLVESYGDLLLVDMYLSAGPEDDFGYIEGFQFYEDFDCYMTERTVKFRVFRLDKDMHCWESMPSLGDLIVFLGDNCSFSAPASQINSTCKGNCIFFTDHFYSCKEEEQEDGVWKSRGIGVFDLGTGRIGPISDYPGYSTMFWPPPHWVYSTATIEEVLEQLSI